MEKLTFNVTVPDNSTDPSPVTIERLNCSGPIDDPVLAKKCESITNKTRVAAPKVIVVEPYELGGPASATYPPQS